MLKDSRLEVGQRGFTLIELVIVITIIGILAAVALPRFASLQADARIAKLNGAVGAMKSAAAMAHAQLLAKSLPADYTGDPSGAQDVIMEGTNVIFTRGYPDDSIIAAIAGVTSPDYNIVADDATRELIRPDTSHTLCQVIYSEATTTTVTPSYDVTGLTEANCI